MKRLPLFFIASLLVALCFVATGCRGDKAAVGKDTTIVEAKYLSIVEGENCVYVTIFDPMDKNKTLAQYALANRKAGKIDIPEGFAEVRVPLGRSVVYSSVHTSAICELGATQSIAGVADGTYFADDDPIASHIASGKIKDIGSSMSPSLEKIIDIQPDALLLSPNELAGVKGLERSKIPVIIMADYLETTPLGRAEWIKFIGLLYGKTAEAETMYAQVCEEYKTLKDLAAKQNSRPQVITELPYQGTWYAPAGGSFMAQMLADAGAAYPWADVAGTGSLSLDEAAILDRGGEAEFWLIKSDTEHDATSLLAAMPHAEAFAAFPDGVYICNTLSTPMFRDLAFHPERILADFIKIFHPDAMPNQPLRYYKLLSK